MSLPALRAREQHRGLLLTAAVLGENVFGSASWKVEAGGRRRWLVRGAQAQFSLTRGRQN